MQDDATNAQGCANTSWFYGDARVNRRRRIDLCSARALYLDGPKAVNPGRPCAQYSGLDHANHTRALARSRAWFVQTAHE